MNTRRLIVILLGATLALATLGRTHTPLRAQTMDGPAVLAWWRTSREAMLAAYRPLDPATRIGWYGPSMSARSFMTAAVWICAFLLAAATEPAWNLRRALPPVLIAAVVCLLLVPIGRAERAHRARTQVAGMRQVVQQVGALDGPALDSYRYLSLHFECLLYRRGRDPFAFELCVDGAGRVVETIDRRTAPKPRIHSLRDDATRSTLYVDRSEVTRLLHELNLSLPPESG